MNTIHKKIIIMVMAIFIIGVTQISFASSALFTNLGLNGAGTGNGSVNLNDTKKVEEKVLKILAESVETEGIKTLTIVEGVSYEVFVAAIVMKANDNLSTNNNSNFSDSESFMQYVRDAEESIKNGLLLKPQVKDVLESPTGKFLQSIGAAYDKDISSLGEAAKSKLLMDLEAKDKLGLNDVPKEVVDKLFDEVYDANIAFENMTEAQKEYMRKTGMTFGFQYQATDLAKDLSKVAGSDTKEWAEFLKDAADPNVLKEKYGSEYNFTEDVENNIKELARSIDSSRDAIYDQILKVSDIYQQLISAADYKALVKQYGVDQFVLYTVGGDQNIKDLVQNSPDYIKLLKMYQDYKDKYGIDYKANITSSNTINFGQYGQGTIEEVDTLSQQNFHAISKVIFTITKKSGAIGNLSLLNDSRLQELAKQYSGLGNKYYDLTGRYIPRFAEVSRTYNSVTYEINYTEGVNFDGLRDFMSKIYQKYNPVIGFNVAKDGVYKIDVNVFANTLVEYSDIHAAHQYSWTTGSGKTLQHHTGDCNEIRYWPYMHRIVNSGSYGAHRRSNYKSNKTPDKIIENTWVGSVEWEVNAKAGAVEIPLMGQEVGKSMFITK